MTEMAEKAKKAEAEPVEPVVQEPEKAKLIKHVVKEGDTLRALAFHYLGRGSRMREIRAINHLATDILTVGEELIIPEM